MAATDKNAPATLIVGGAGGIGRALVKRLLSDGHHVAVLDRAKEHCASLAASYKSDQRLLIEEAEATNAAAVASVLDALERGGRPVTGMVHCAASVTTHRVPRAVSLTEWERVIRDSLTSAFVTAQAVTQRLFRGGNGRIVFISSVSVYRTTIEDPAYVASKSGLHGLVHSLARSLGRRNITVNAVAPGLVHTALTQDVLVPEVGDTVSGAWVRDCPLGRLCSADEVAAAVTFLLSPDASFISGAVIPVDGGYHC